MTDERLFYALFLIAALVLPLSALLARREARGTILKSLLAWIAIIALILVLVAWRGELAGIGSRIDAMFGIGGQQRVSGGTVRIEMADDGHFWANVTLNGVERRLMVDSGATWTAISEETARAAGIVADGGAVPLNTANGQVMARRGRIAEIGLEGLRTRDLGVVVSPAFGNTNVLGMNFLSRLQSWRVEGRTLILETGAAAPPAAE